MKIRLPHLLLPTLLLCSGCVLFSSQERNEAPDQGSNDIKTAVHWGVHSLRIDRGVFSCDAAIKQTARRLYLFEQKRVCNSDGFRYHYLDINDTSYVIETIGTHQETLLKVRVGNPLENGNRTKAFIKEIVQDLGSATAPLQ